MTVVILAVEVQAAAIEASSMIRVAVDNTAESEDAIG
tara:strand:- start:467 stop:577 length:111 start_codon:yes stop_codon:yes gene_type:complete